MTAGKKTVGGKGGERVDGDGFRVACCEEGKGWMWYGGPGALIQFGFERRQGFKAEITCA